MQIQTIFFGIVYIMTHGETPTEGFGICSTVNLLSRRRSASRSSGAAFAPGTGPASPWGRPQERTNAATLADSALGVTVGAGVRTGGGL